MPRGVPKSKEVKSWDEFIVVTYDQDVFYFKTEKTLLDFLNEVNDYESAEDEKRNWEVLDRFPIPAHGHEGEYCPMAQPVWTRNSVIVLKNGTIISVQKNTTVKQVVSYEYTFSPAPIAAAKKRGRPRSKK